MWVSLVLCIFTSLLMFRIIWVWRCVWKPGKCKNKQGKNNLKLLVVAGSGGHTTEILKLTKCLSNRYKPRLYLLAQTDKMSLSKIEQSECTDNEYAICSIPRSREVQQSWISTIGTFLYATLWTIPIVLRYRPDIIMCNGPGTCIPVCLIGFFSKVFFIKDTVIIYVESICRVTSLSLSGKILYYFSDHFLVQWPQLRAKYDRATYLGRLS